MFKLAVYILAVLCVGCAPQSVDPHVELSAVFVTSEISRVESVLDAVAKNHGLTVFSKDREKMKFLSGGEEAFFISLYYSDNPIVTVTNVGSSNRLVLLAMDYKKLPISDLEAVSTEVVDKIHRDTKIRLLP